MAEIQSQSPAALSRQNPFESGLARFHGCLWFDGLKGRGPRDPKTGGGWAAVGGDPAFRFEKVQELPLDITWWTNLSRAEQWRFGQLRFFKESSFWGPEWASLLIETESIATPMDIPHRVQAWSEVFARAADFFSLWSSRAAPEKIWEWGEGAAHEAIRSVLWPIDPPSRLELDFIFKRTYHERVKVSFASGGETQKSVQLSFPRWSHARKMLQALFPSGEWTAVLEWGVQREDRLQWIDDHPLPLLVQVDSIHFLPGADAARLGALFLGDRVKVLGASTAEPLWLTQMELTEFKKYAYFEVLSGYQAEGWKEIPTFPFLGGEHDDPLAPWSVTQGLVSHGVWLALASPCRDVNSRKKGPISARALWFRALDRLYCFAAAMSLSEAGFQVLSYGQGQVQVALSSLEEGTSLARLLPSAGLLIPQRLKPESAPDSLLHSDDLKSMKEPSSIVKGDHWLKESSPSDWFLNIDRLIWPWPGKKAREVLELSVKSLLGSSARTSPEVQEWWKASLTLQARAAVNRLKQRKKD